MSKQPHVTRISQRGIKRPMPANRVVITHNDQMSVGTHPKHPGDAKHNAVGRQLIKEGIAGDTNAFAPINSGAADENAATFNNSGGKY